MMDHFDRHRVLSTRQHGFRRGHSCETQLLMTVDDLTRAHNMKQQVDVAVLDLSKAFDTVPHERLLHKLAHYGIQGEVLHWIRAFLQERSQCVVLNGQTSPAVHVASGVPQGTVMGPIIFLCHKKSPNPLETYWSALK